MAISDNALDSYIAEREAYEQNRTFEIQNGDVELPGFDETPTRRGRITGRYKLSRATPKNIARNRSGSI